MNYHVDRGKMYTCLYSRFGHVSCMASGFMWEGVDECVHMDCV